jgi:hypothetical protein
MVKIQIKKCISYYALLRVQCFNKINKLTKITSQIVLFLGNKFTNLLSKAFLKFQACRGKNREHENSCQWKGNIREKSRI